MERSVDRRTALGLAAGVLGWTALPAGTAGAQAGGGAGGGTAEPDYGGWLDGVGNYDGTTADMRGRAEVTVQVGVEANGGPYGFGPPAVRVDPGATVRWEWTGASTHSVVAEGGHFDSGEVLSEPGVNFEHTFEEEGVYRYYCAPHRALGMKGAVAVGSDVPTRTPAQTPTPTPEPSPEGEWLPAPPAADWPSVGFDAANTRYNPGTVGPVEDVRASGSVRFRDYTRDPLLAAGRLFVPLGGADRLVALDAATGERLWTGPGGLAGAATDEAVYLTTEAGDVLRLDAATGDPRWRRGATDGLANDTLLAGGRLLVAGDGGLTALDAAGGDRAWRRQPGGTVEGVAAADGGLVASGTRHFGVDRQDPVLWVAGLDDQGRERWRFERESYPPTRPTVADGRVYVGSGSHAVHAVDAASGRERWTAGLGSAVTGLAAVPSDADAPTGARGTVYAGCNDRHLYAFDAGTGDRLWRRRTRGTVSAPAVAGGVVYVANTGFVGDVEEDGSVERDQAVHGFDAASGDRLWTVELGPQPVPGTTPGDPGSSPLVADGTLFVNANSTDHTFAVHAVTGAAAHRSRNTSGTDATAAAAEPDSSDGSGGGAGTDAPSGTTPGGGSPGFTAVGTALGLLGAAGLQRLRGADD